MKLNQVNEYTTELEHPYSILKFVCEKWTHYPPTVSVDYIEHSPAHGYSDTETSVPLTKQDAEAIIEFLKYSLIWKIAFLNERYKALCNEWRSRDYNINQISEEDLLKDIDKSFMGSYIPTQEAIKLNQQRIDERLKGVKK